MTDEGRVSPSLLILETVVYNIGKWTVGGTDCGIYENNEKQLVGNDGEATKAANREWTFSAW